VCASPAYLETRGSPQHPDDLVHHECLIMRYGLTTDRDWPFLIDGKERRVVVQGQRIVNDGELVRVWCRSGFGIARKSRLDVEADLREGALVELLQEFSAIFLLVNKHPALSPSTHGIALPVLLCLRNVF
jgi:DNA-binding transcriptional LysR family regulator